MDKSKISNFKKKVFLYYQKFRSNNQFNALHIVILVLVVAIIYLSNRRMVCNSENAVLENKVSSISAQLEYLDKQLEQSKDLTKEQADMLLQQKNALQATKSELVAAIASGNQAQQQAVLEKSKRMEALAIQNKVESMLDNSNAKLHKYKKTIDSLRNIRHSKDQSAEVEELNNQIADFETNNSLLKSEINTLKSSLEGNKGIIDAEVLNTVVEIEKRADRELAKFPVTNGKKLKASKLYDEAILKLNEIENNAQKQEIKERIYKKRALLP